jgi:hypothetical protein
LGYILPFADDVIHLVLNGILPFLRLDFYSVSVDIVIMERQQTADGGLLQQHQD